MRGRISSRFDVSECLLLISIKCVNFVRSFTELLDWNRNAFLSDTMGGAEEAFLWMQAVCVSRVTHEIPTLQLILQDQQEGKRFSFSGAYNMTDCLLLFFFPVYIENLSMYTPVALHSRAFPRKSDTSPFLDCHRFKRNSSVYLIWLPRIERSIYRLQKEQFWYFSKLKQRSD